MNPSFHRLVMQNNIFVWIGVATVLILLVPLIAMSFTNQVNWGAGDFMLMGSLIFGAGCAFVVTARKAPHKYWPVLAILFAILLFYIWAELAVGVFTDLGN